MASEDCRRFESEAASFVLGDVAAPLRSQIVAHLDSCGACRREAVMLATALDSISATVAPVAPSEGFAERVVAAAEPAMVSVPLGAAGPLASSKPPSIVQKLATRRARRDESVTAAATLPDAVAPVRGLQSDPFPSRPVTVVARRRRTLLALTGLTAALLAFGAGLQNWPVLGLALCSALLESIYLALVVSVTHTKARQDLFASFRSDRIADDSYWRELEPELLAPSEAAEDLAVPGVVAVNNTDLLRFVLSYFAGWALTPLVVLIRLMRGDLAGIEQSPLLGHIVDLQRRGRAQSLRLLVAGATTVAVAGGGAALVAPAVAWAAPATQSYTVHAGDTLSAIAERYGVSTSYLAQLNGISDPNLVFAGQVIKVGGGAGGTSSGGTSTYTIRPGDTLDSIAARFGTTVSRLVSLNNIANPNLIFAGQTLRVGGSGSVPPPTRAVTVSAVSHTYTVQAGDTLGSIAARFGTTVANLAALNHIADPNLIFAGQVIHLSGAALPAAAPDPAPAPAIATAAPAPAPAGYVNPFTRGSWSPARIDEGVDWIPNAVSPVVAIGDGVITYSSINSGWPGGGFISYRLTSGSHAGYYVYVAEHITNLLPAGTVVSAGQQIATALPGSPWTEWGWASGYAPAPAPSAAYNGAPDGTATAGGKAFARFLMSLGVAGIENPGPGPTIP